MANDAHQFGIWQPWKPQEIASFFSTLNAPWWIAGGWAIDLFLMQYPENGLKKNASAASPPPASRSMQPGQGYQSKLKRSSDFAAVTQTREHDDIDVQVLRRDQVAVRKLFAEWDLQEAHPTSPMSAWPFREWEPDQPLRPGVDDVWCRPSKTAPWTVQLMIADSSDQQWLCRRDPGITRPITSIGHRTSEGIPYIAPEIQLLYKAKGRRPKDEADFMAVHPHLDQQSRAWLTQALTIVHPGHPWLAHLEKA